jgi:hypothetical protein
MVAAQTSDVGAVQKTLIVGFENVYSNRSLKYTQLLLEPCCYKV